jgi:AraC-like DNA-binding protein
MNPMPPAATPQIVGFVTNQTERARITGALRGWALVLWVGALGELPEAVRRAKEPPVAAIVAARDLTGSDGGRVLLRLRTLAPNMPIVAHCHAGVDHASDVRRMADAGAHEFMFAGVDDTGMALRAVLASAQRACAAQQVAVELMELLPEPLAVLGQCCVNHPSEGRTVNGLARLVGVHRKTLLNQCAREGGPSPGELIGWCRLMMAAHLLTATGQTVEWVALELDYPSDTSLRNAMKRYTGLRASEVVKRGGLAAVVRSFKRRQRDQA